MPLLSIITINYNNANGLKKTMDSVISQSFKNFEYLVIDGGSDDGSLDVIKNAQAVHYWVSEKDNGIYDAMNKGIIKAKGDYILFLNSGDLLLNDSILQKVINLNLKEDIWYADLIFDFGNGNHKLMKLPKTLTKMHMYKDNIWHPTSFINRSLFLKYGNYNLMYKIAADYDFFFKAIVVKDASTASIPFPTALYDTSGLSSLSENLDQIKKERVMIHQSYLTIDEISYYDNLMKFKIQSFSKWLINKPKATRITNLLFNVYSKLRN